MCVAAAPMAALQPGVCSAMRPASREGQNLLGSCYQHGDSLYAGRLSQLHVRRLSATGSANPNAFAGSHLGVPAGPLESACSLNVSDYAYVWGVPQQAGLSTHGFSQTLSSGSLAASQLPAGLASGSSVTLPGALKRRRPLLSACSAPLLSHK